jgi:YVTN family beta-propeller protein
MVHTVVMGGGSRRWWLLAAAVSGLLAVAAVLAVSTRSLLAAGDRGAAVATVYALPVAVLSLLATVVFGVLAWRQGNRDGLGERLGAEARRLAGQVRKREDEELGRLVADTGDVEPAEVKFSQPELVFWRGDGGDQLADLPTRHEPNESDPVGEPAEQRPPRTPAPGGPEDPASALPTSVNAQLDAPATVAGATTAIEDTARNVPSTSGAHTAPSPAETTSSSLPIRELLQHLRTRPALAAGAVLVAVLLALTIVLLDSPTNSVTATISVESSPRGVAITPDGGRAYITNYGRSSVSVIDTTSNHVTATIPVGPSPGGVVITPDGGHAYITNFGTNSVSVIDTGTG